MRDKAALPSSLSPSPPSSPSPTMVAKKKKGAEEEEDSQSTDEDERAAASGDDDPTRRLLLLPTREDEELQRQQQHSRRRSRHGFPFGGGGGGRFGYASSASDGTASVVVSPSSRRGHRRQRSCDLQTQRDSSASDFFTLVHGATTKNPSFTTNSTASKLPPNSHKKVAAAEREEAAAAAELLLPPSSSSPPPSPLPSSSPSPSILFPSSSKSNGIPSSAKALASVDLSDMTLPPPAPTHRGGDGHLRPSLSRSSSLGGEGGGGGGKANALGTFFVLSLLLCSGYFLRDYIRWVLVAAEHQDDAVVILILVLLYAIVSMPFAWGYILINIATGYLYGVVKGTLVTIFTATAGIFIAHHLIRMCMSKYVRRWLVYSSTLSESLDAVMSSQQQAFKIVLLSRLTPVPFGLQNAIFAVNCSLSTTRYLQATMIGLLPCQIINAYLGSTFRSMEQLLSDSETTQLGALILGVQLAVAVGVTYFVLKRARQELDRSILEKEKLQQQQMLQDEQEQDLDLVEKGENAAEKLHRAKGGVVQDI